MEDLEKNNSRTLLEPPQLPGCLPGVGHAAAFFRDPVAFLVTGQNAMRTPFTFNLLGKKVSYFFGPQANAEVLAAEDDVLDRQIAYRAMIASLGEGVGIGAEPHILSEQIKLLLPTLQSRAMGQHVSIMFQEVQTYVSDWDTAGEVDLLEVMDELSARIAAHCMAGPRLAPHLKGKLPHLLRDLQSGLALGSVIDPYLPLPPFRKRDRAREELLRAIKAVHRDAASDDTDPGRSQWKLFERFKEAEFSDGTRSDEDLAARLVLNAMFAATETTATSATWTGVLLLQHPQWIPVLHEEQDRLFSDTVEATPQLVHQMVNLRQCVMEAERMQPPIALMMRTTKAEFIHDRYRIPPGRMIMLSPAASHRLPDIFQDPDRYDPDRFGPGRNEHRSRPSPLISFGGGQHPCLGMNFAYHQIAVIWSVLLRTFDMELVTPSPRRDRTALMNTPRKPLVRYKRRAIARQGIIVQ